MPRRRKTGAVYPIKYTTRRKLKDGTVRVYEGWHARVDGKWVSAKTYKECDRKIGLALKEKNQWGVAMDHTATLGDYANEWYEGYKDNLDPGSRCSYRTMIDRHLAQYARLKLADVTPTLVRRMVAGMRNPDGSPASIGSRQNLHKVLNMVFKAAVADRLIPTNPVSGVSAPKAKDEGAARVRPHDAFTVDQLRTMLAVATENPSDGVRQWWRILTGMRQGEILGASIEDLDLHPIPGTGMWDGYYTVNWKLESVKRLHGCGKADRNGVYPCGYKAGGRCSNPVWDVPPGFDMVPLSGSKCLTRPKTHTGRVVPIIPELGTVMHRWLESMEGMPNPYGLLFPAASGMPLRPADDLASFRDLLRRAGVPNPEDRYGHECRNSVVSLLFSMKVDPGKIQRIVGHSSLAMAEYYRRVPAEELLAGMETMGDRLGLRQIEWKHG